MTSNPQDFFSSFKKKNDFKLAVKNKLEEGLYLEFKQKKDRRHPRLDDRDKEYFADALSQFANSDGGVLIWGIKTKKIPNDRAVELKPINQADIFANNLREYLKDAVTPFVDGVVIKTVFEDEKSKQGYVNILIPVSDKTPHRSLVSREYLKRNMVGKYRLEHFDLEDMFGRRQKPYLRLAITKVGNPMLDVKKADDRGFLPEVNFSVYIINDGRALGKDGMLVFWCPDKKIMSVQFLPLGIQSKRIDEMYNGKPTYQLNLRNSIFYPTVSTRIGEIKVKMHKKYLIPAKSLIKWVIHADNMVSKEGVLSLLEAKTK